MRFNRTNPLLGAGLACLDAAVCYASLHADQSLESSQLLGLAAAGVVYWASGAAARRAAWTQLAVLAIAVFFLREGVLTLAVAHWHWTPAAAIWLIASGTAAAMLLAGNIAFEPRDSITRWQILITALVCYSTALRCLYAGLVELMPEESYYWNYAQHLDYGYLDHPPMVAWLVWTATHIFGQNEFAVRAGSVLSGAVTTAYVYRLTRNVYGDTAALASVALAQTLPFFFLSAFLMTPDAPMSAAWAACLFYLERALVAEKADAWWRAGVALGLGLASKYTILLLAVSAGAYLVGNRASRHWLRRSEPYLAVLCVLLPFAPVLVWNARNDWVSFAFQTSRRLAETPKFALLNLLGSVLLLLTPVGTAAMVMALRAPSRDAAGRRFLLLAVLLPLAVFFLFSLRHQVKLDWTGPLWIAALPVLSAEMVWTGACLGGIRDWIRSAWPATLTAMILLYAAGFYHLVHGWPGAPYSSRMEMFPVGWRALTDRLLTVVQDEHRRTGSDPIIVGMDRYAIASEIAFYGRQILHAPLLTSSAHLFQGIGLMYERWTPARSLTSKTLLLVAYDPNELAGIFVESRAARFGPVQIVAATQGGKSIRNLYYRFAYDYRPFATE